MAWNEFPTELKLVLVLIALGFAMLLVRIMSLA